MRSLKFFYKASRFLLTLAFVTWLIETVYFLVKQGYHWYATDPAEVMWDHIAVATTNLGFLCLLICCYEVVGAVIKTNDNGK